VNLRKNSFVNRQSKIVNRKFLARLLGGDG